MVAWTGVERLALGLYSAPPRAPVGCAEGPEAEAELDRHVQVWQGGWGWGWVAWIGWRGGAAKGGVERALQVDGVGVGERVRWGTECVCLLAVLWMVGGATEDRGAWRLWQLTSVDAAWEGLQAVLAPFASAHLPASPCLYHPRTQLQHGIPPTPPAGASLPHHVPSCASPAVPRSATCTLSIITTTNCYWYFPDSPPPALRR